MTLTKTFKAFALTAAFAFAAVTTQAADPAKTELTVSASQGPYSDLFLKGVKPILEKEGYTIKAVNLSDLLQADFALADGEVDFNVEQHTAYMNHFNKTQDAKLVALAPVPTVLAGIYPGAKKSLADLKDGDHFAIPNDAANTARALAILQKAGLIKIDPVKNLATVSVNDIIENKRNLRFTEMKSLNIPSVATDFDYIVITGSIVYNAKIDPKSALLNEDIQPYLMLQLVVNGPNKDAVWAKDIVKAYQSKEFREYLKANNNGLWYYP